MMLRNGGCLLGMLMLAGCGTPPSIVTGPTTSRPQPTPVTQANNGSIYNPATAKMLFEESVARRVGDTLYITIEESLASSNKSSTSTSREGSSSMSATGGSTVPYLPSIVQKLLNINVGTSSSNTFDGSGSASTTNTFKGSMVVTVIEVLPNGNLVVGGERAINNGGQITEMRLTGVVNPRDIKSGNTISSTKIADARIEQVGQGTIADANVMAWLSRFFFSVLPF